MSLEKSFFDINGYTIYRNIFSRDEIEKFRGLVKSSLEEDLNLGRAWLSKEQKKEVYYTHGDMIIKPIGKLFFNTKTVKIAKEILGEKPCYFGEGNYQVGVGDRGFHRDSVDEIIEGKSTRVFGHGPDWTDAYKLIRIGVYLQDHDKFSGGVKFQMGSNKLPYNKGKSVLADTKAGDVVVWDLRTFHSGNSVRLKFFSDTPLHRKLEDLLPSFFTLPEKIQRNSVFMVFGADNHHTRRHIEKHYKVKFKDHINVTNYSKQVISQCDKFGVKLISDT